MAIFAINEQARQAHFSPSVALEKGAFRMRAPRKPSSVGRTEVTIRPGHYRGASRASTVPEKQMAVIVVLLVILTVSCFAAAYYLFTTR